MKEHGTLFKDEMVRALLSGNKTETRRLVKPQPLFTGATGDSFEWHGGASLIHAGYGARYVHTNAPGLVNALLAACKWKKGHVLWVKEAYARQSLPAPDTYSYIYRADLPTLQGDSIHWIPSLLMPRIASRIILTMVDVRVQRLWEITEEDAHREGVKSKPHYVDLWDSINGKIAPWSTNPWVYVLNFKP